MYFQKDLIFYQRKEFHGRRHGGTGLQDERRAEKVNDRSVRNGVAHSPVQEMGFDRNAFSKTLNKFS